MTYLPSLIDRHACMQMPTIAHNFPLYNCYHHAREDNKVDGGGFLPIIATTEKGVGLDGGQNLNLLLGNKTKSTQSLVESIQVMDTSTSDSFITCALDCFDLEGLQRYIMLDRVSSRLIRSQDIMHALLVITTVVFSVS